MSQRSRKTAGSAALGFLTRRAFAGWSNRRRLFFADCVVFFLALTALALFLLNVWLAQENLKQQNELQRRQAMINQGTPIAPFEQNLRAAIAEAASKSRDGKLLDLLKAEPP